MRRAALVTSLVLGAATLAPIAAAQNPRWDPKTYDRDRYPSYDRDRPYDRDRRSDVYDRRGTMLGTTRAGRWFAIGPDVGRFSAVRLEAARGEPYVAYMLVRFHNGQTQRIEVNRRLDQGEAIDVDLPGRWRAIDSLAVVGPRDRWSRVTIVGLRDR